jgi:hypothetical protein
MGQRLKLSRTGWSRHRRQDFEIMASTLSTSPRFAQRPLMVVAAVAGILIAATAALWAHYGTAVFYEMIVAGIATCL